MRTEGKNSLFRVLKNFLEIINYFIPLVKLLAGTKIFSLLPAILTASLLPAILTTTLGQVVTTVEQWTVEQFYIEKRDNFVHFISELRAEYGECSTRELIDFHLTWTMPLSRGTSYYSKQP